MLIRVRSTDKIVNLNGVPARVWEGYTGKGTPCHAFITRMAVDKKAGLEKLQEFEKELEETHAPASAEIQAYPGNLIL